MHEHSEDVQPAEAEGALVPVDQTPGDGTGEHQLLVLGQAMAMERHPVAVYLSRLAATSRRVMLSKLQTVARLLTAGQADAWAINWAAVESHHTHALRTALVEMQKLAPASANLHLAALRGVLKAAWRLGYLSAEAWQRAADVPPVKGVTLLRGRALTGGELRALFDRCVQDDGPAGARDAAMLGVMYGGGLRRSELVGLDLVDYDQESGALAVRHGKGNKARMVYVAGGTAEALSDWLLFRGTTPGPLFCHINKGGRIVLRRLADQAVFDILTKRLQEAGVARCSPHDMRRTFIGDLLDAGADISTVQQLAGHSNVSTTARYDRRGEAVKRKAVGLLHVPYSRVRRPASEEMAS
jgi:site-specific recombinase XerD